MFAIIILAFFLLLFYIPDFEIRLRLGEKEIKLEIGNTPTITGKKSYEDIIISSSYLEGSFTLNTGGNLYNANGSINNVNSS